MAVLSGAGAAVGNAAASASTAESSEQVRFGLTFCSPHRLTASQESHQIFAKISHGQQKFEVIQWPSPALPFNLTLGSSLFVQVFSAKDALAFQRGNADPLAVCHVPISRVADLVRTSHTRTLNLALDLPDSKSDEAACRDSRLLTERFERGVQSASKYPMQPKICIVVEPFKGDATGSTPTRFDSGRFATPPSIEVVTTRSGPPPLDPGRVGSKMGQLITGAPPRQVPSEAEMLLRSVSAPTAKDLTNGSRPSKTPTDAAGAPAPATVSGQLAAPEKPSSSVQETAATASAPRAPAAVSPNLSQKSTSPAQARTQTLTPFTQTRDFGSPRSGQRSQGNSNNGEVPNWTVTWQTRWAEEHARIQRLAADFERAFRQQQKSEDRKIRSLEQSVALLSERREAWQLKRQLAAWRQWMAGEKAVRSYSQLTNEHAELKEQHEEEKLEVSKALEFGIKHLASQAKQSRLRVNREVASSTKIQRFWTQIMSEYHVGVTMTAWKRYTARMARLGLLGSGLERSVSLELRHRVFRAWLAQASVAKREAMRIEASKMQAEYPQRYRNFIKGRVYDVLRWTSSAQDARAVAVLAVAIFRAWISASGRSKRSRLCGLLVLGLGSGGVHKQVMVRRTLAAWYNEVDQIKTDRCLEVERGKSRQVHSGIRARAFQLLGTIRSFGEVSIALAAMLCWRFFVSSERMSCALEQMRIEHQATKGVTGSMGMNLEGAKYEVRRERDAWDEERSELNSKLQQVQALLAETKAKTARVLREKAEVETLCAAASEEELQTKGELISARADKVHALEQLEAKLEKCQALEGDVREQGAAVEARARAAHAEIAQLQAEAIKHRDGRLSDLKETKALAKDALTKHDSTARDLMESRSTDQQMWMNKIQQSEKRRNKLEQDLVLAQRSVTRQSPRQASFEVERQALQRRLEQTEGRLATTELQANSCADELQILRGEHALVKKRHEELEAKKRLLEDQRTHASRIEERPLPNSRYQEEQRVPGLRLDDQRLPSSRLEEQRLSSSRLEEQRMSSSRLDEQRMPSSRLEEQRVPSSRLEEQSMPNSRLDEQRVPSSRLEEQRAAAAVGSRTWAYDRGGPTSPRGRGSASGDDQRNQDLRAVLEDVQRTVRAPRSPLSNSLSSSQEVGSPGLSPVRPPVPSEGTSPRGLPGSPQQGLMSSPQASHRSLPNSPRGALQGRGSATAPGSGPPGSPQAMSSPRGAPMSPRSQRLASGRPVPGMTMGQPPFSARERTASNESLPSDSVIQGPPWSARSQGGQPPDRPPMLGAQGREPAATASGLLGSGSAPTGGSVATSAATDPGRAIHAEEPAGSSTELPVGSSTETEAPWAFRSRDAVAPRQEQGPPLQWLKTPPRSVPQMMEQHGQPSEMRGREYPRSSDIVRPEFGASPVMSQHSTPASGRASAGDVREVRGIYGELQAYPNYAEPSPMHTPQASPRQDIPVGNSALQKEFPTGSSVTIDMDAPPPKIEALRGHHEHRGDGKGGASHFKTSDTSPRTLPRTPPRSPRRRAPTPPSSQAASVSAEADGDDAARARNPNRGITAARAGAMWRQQTHAEHDAERKTLQERVEQMRRQIDAERAAAPRRQYAGHP